VRRVIVMLVLVLAGMSFGLISPTLQEHLTTAQAGQKLPVQIVLKEQFDKVLLNSLVDGMPRPVRRVEVARILKDFSARQQAGVLEYLATTNAENVQSFWIVNAVYCEATPAVIQQLSERPEVNYVNYDRVYCPDLLEPATPTQPTDEIAWGVDKIDAPAVWALGYTGQGIVCGHIDTGCNYDHPDLADHMWTDANYPHHGWNFESNNDDPMDVSGHGTHTSGTVAGDGTGGTQTGVAPDAQMMICRVMTTIDTVAESQTWAAMEFVVSPPLSPSHGADLYTMSLGWYISWNPRQATWRTIADNVNAAGLSQIVAAGNERGQNFPPTACRCPGNVPPPWWNPENTGVGALSGVVSIGATDSSDGIASFSSPGPVTWSGVAPFDDYPYPPGLTRPDVSAPGVDVKSCSYTGSGYALMSGTSMATPHTAGVVCLMLSKNPNLTPAEVDSILELTAVDLGPGGKDNDFGAGRIDALAAVNYVSVSNGPALKLISTRVVDSTGNNNGVLDPGETAQLLVALNNVGRASCNSVTGRFRTYDARLTVNDSIGGWGNIPPGDTVANDGDPFTFNADSAIPPGTQFTCSLFVQGDSALDYDKKMEVLIVVGVPPGGIIWGPKTCAGMPTGPGLYGVTYNSNDGLIYCTYFGESTIYKYSSDSMLTPQGTITAPQDFCTDIDYIAHDDALWLFGNQQMAVYKISPGGTVLSQFDLPFTAYPCGLTENEVEHRLYASDRRTTPASRQIIYVTDTLGNRQDSIIHPLVAPFGTRCLALDSRCPTNPPSLLNIWAWNNAAGSHPDSCGMYELDRVGGTVLNGYVFPDKAWDLHGIEYDPRDASYWITIAQGGADSNMIVKVAGFNFGRRAGVAEPRLGSPDATSRLVVRAQPNPFSGSTNLSVRLPAAGSVDLKVYDNSGRVVRTLARGASVTARALFPWDGRNDKGEAVAPGIYFYRVKSATAEAWGKVVLSH